MNIANLLNHDNVPKVHLSDNIDKDTDKCKITPTSEGANDNFLLDSNDVGTSEGAGNIPVAKTSINPVVPKKYANLPRIV